MAGSSTRGAHAAIQATPGEEAIEIALRPLAYNEAPRILLLGDSRCGKTEIARRIIAAYLKRTDGIAVVADDKDPAQPQFAGQYFRDADEIESPEGLARLKPDPRVLVCRGDPQSLDDRASVALYEGVARFQWKLRAGKNKRKSLGVFDELDRACEGGQWLMTPSAIGWGYGKGGSAGVGSLAGAQETESVPRQAFNQATVAFVVRMMGNPVRLLKQRGYCNGGVDQVLPRLPGDELPPPQRGYFVALERGRPWDGRVYRFATPAR